MRHESLLLDVDYAYFELRALAAALKLPAWCLGLSPTGRKPAPVRQPELPPPPLDYHVDV